MQRNGKNSKSVKLKYNFSKLIGIGFIFFAVIITLSIRCLNNSQYFILYALVGVGIALLLSKSAEKATANIKLYNIAIYLGGGVALPFILFIYNPIGFFKPDECNLKLSLTSKTVFVHGKKGIQDMILRQKGNVIMDVGPERKKSSINENGQAFYQNLRIGDSVRLSIDFSEPYKPTHPDSIYIIKLNGDIYLEVALQGLDKLSGMVIYNDFPLENVVVKLIGQRGYLLDTSDGTGNFNFAIPEEMQTNEYQVWFIKKGFKTKFTTAFPQIGIPLNIVMEK